MSFVQEYISIDYSSTLFLSFFCHVVISFCFPDLFIRVFVKRGKMISHIVLPREICDERKANKNLALYFSCRSQKKKIYFFLKIFSYYE